MRDLYKPVSKYYNLLSTIYSLGQIPRCRKAFKAEILEAVRETGSDNVTVCFVGAGHGDEAIVLAKMGAVVTVVEISASMLAVFQQNLSRESDEVIARVETIHDDIRNVRGDYDWVVVNFFLNVFPESEMEEMMDVVLEKCNDVGNLVIGDFYDDTDANGLVRTLQNMNWYVALSVFRVFVNNAKHPIYCYRESLSKRGWKVKEVKEFGLLGISFYQSVWFSKMYNDD